MVLIETNTGDESPDNIFIPIPLQELWILHNYRLCLHNQKIMFYYDPAKNN